MVRAKRFGTLRFASLTGIALTTVLLSALGATAQATAETTQAASSECQTSTAPPAAAQLKRSEAGYLESEKWAANDAAQQTLRHISTQLDQTFGEAEKLDADKPLRNGLIGAVLDQTNQTMVVVVDPALVDSTETQQNLRAASTQAASRSTLGEAAEVAVTVKPACRSASELAAVRQALQDRDWHPDAANATYSSYVDASDSTVHINLAPRDEALAAVLEQKFGDAVTVEISNVARASRWTDAEPHYGASAIGTYNYRYCSSAFTLWYGGYLAQATAGHCFANSTNVYSGTEFVGVAGGRYDYPAYDMMRITAPSESFDNWIYTDPRSISREVLYKANPYVGGYVCQGGYSTRALCGFQVNSLAASLCDADGCTVGLMSANRAGESVRYGDSGGPVYAEHGANAADVRGMVIGFGNGGSTMYAEKISIVESHLGMTLALG